MTQGATTTEGYSYDPVGNRLSSLGVSPYSYNNSNQLTSTPTAAYTYDNNGNTLTKTEGSNVTSYTWDFENRLVSVTLPGSGGTVSFKYGPFGRRIQKSSASGTTNYAYDGADLVEEVDATGSVLARYAMGPGIDQPLAMLRGGVTGYYQADGLGSVTSLTDGAGSLAATYTYDSFGKLVTSSGTVVNPFRYTARELDAETGLYYDRARYYDSGTGRFLSEDPKKDGVAGSLYAYVQNSPVNLIDPLGTTGLIPRSNYKPEWIAAFNEGFAEAMNRLQQKDCRRLFCKNKEKLDPSKVLGDTDYDIYDFGNTDQGAQKVSRGLVWLNEKGPFFGPSTTVYIPDSNQQIKTRHEVPFPSLAVLRAFILLHELGHQAGIFKADLFPWQNGTHSLRVLENCFKDVKVN